MKHILAICWEGVVKSKWIVTLSLLVMTLVGALYVAERYRGRPGIVHEDKQVHNFRLEDIEGRHVALSDYQGMAGIVVVFIGTECPLANLYLGRLKELHQEYAARGIQFLAINSNSDERPERVSEHARKYTLPFPVLRDPDGKVADAFGARRTPEAFVLDGRRSVRYQGRIDDQHGIGYQRSQPTRRYLAEALEDVLAGSAVRTPHIEAVGCHIDRPKEPVLKGEVTYSKHVARILQSHCQDCHRPGQIAPFSLLNYGQARRWSATMREAVTEGRMPPWHADPRYGRFANDRSLPRAHRDALLAWIDQGCPKGDDKDLPAPRTFADYEGWAIGKPDVILSMTQAYTVPANAPSGGVPYQLFKVPTEFSEDVWLQKAEVKAGSPAVVHHVTVFLGDPSAAGDAANLDFNALIVAVPGGMPVVYPPEMSRKIPKGSHLVFQMHYTPNGVEQADRSSIGLVFAKKPPRHEIHTRLVWNTTFEIPPGAGGHKVTASSTFDRDVVVISYYPHLHLRGKSFAYRAVYPDGKDEVLLSVPRYDFGWQSTYRLANPIRLPAGTRIACTAVFDNSAANLNNPDPSKSVGWGEQTWDEMMVGLLDYYYPGEARSRPDG